MVKTQSVPAYREVVFQDTSTGTLFLTRSTAASDRTIRWEDGREYPLVKIEISSASHPVFTGNARPRETQGRIDAFLRRWGRMP